MSQLSVRLGPNDVGMKLTREQFATLDWEEPYTFERAKGRLVVMPPPGNPHRVVSRPFRRELGAYWGNHQELVDDVDVEGWIATSPDDDRIPDICVYLAGETSGMEVPDRVPALIFEFVSGSRADQERDYIYKRAEYESVGVAEYVIVDRFKEQVLVLTLEDGEYAEQVLNRTDVYTTPRLPGLSVDLSEVFPEADA